MSANLPTLNSANPHVVIIGGGFAGLYAARALKRAPVRVTLVDCRNHHLFQPLLYQVASAALNASDIAMPIRKVLRRQRNVSVILAEATGVDVDEKKVILLDGEISYDYLIVATGAGHSYLGHDEWANDAPGLKSIEDALQIRRRILLAYEAAERETDPVRREAWLTFVVVGGGATGVELAGALAEISRHAMERDFRNIDPREARIILVEGLERILPAFPPGLSARAEHQLRRRGIEVVTDTKVTDIDKEGASLGDDRIEARTILWAAGVAASPLGKSLGAPLDSAGRVRVCGDLTIPDHPDVFVIGDLAAVDQDGQMVPGVATAAIQEGDHAAENIAAAVRGESYRTFRYVDKGMLATIGRGAGVADIRSVELSGFPAWLAWLVVHIYFMIGFRNRLMVLMEWGLSYMTHERGARLITGSLDRLVPVAPEPEGSATGRRNSRSGEKRS